MIVIPMAGMSRRFTEAGYTLPKYMLPAHQRSLFAHAVDSFRHYFKTEPLIQTSSRRCGFGVNRQSIFTRLLNQSLHHHSPDAFTLVVWIGSRRRQIH